MKSAPAHIVLSFDPALCSAPDSMVRLPSMRFRSDQLAKQLAAAFLEGWGETTSSEEVLADAQQIDIWHVPTDPTLDRSSLGLLGHMTEGPSLLEPCHAPPDDDEVRDCIRKHLSFHHLRRTKARSAQPEVMVSLATCWIVSSGRPASSLQAFAFAPAAGWPPGAYETTPGLQVKMLVLTELPRSRDTLPLRLLGRGALLRDALRELRALPPDAWERTAAAPVFVRLQVELPKDRTAEEEEIAMTGHEMIQDIERKAKQTGVVEGAAVSFAHMIERRLGRSLQEDERERLRERVGSLGSTRVGDVILDLSADDLATWLADPNAR